MLRVAQGGKTYTANGPICSGFYDGNSVRIPLRCKHMRVRRLDQQGFTFPELVVVSVISVLLLLVVTALLRPAVYDAQMHNAVRRTNIAQIGQVLQKYKAETGSFPSNIPTTATGIGSGLLFDACRLLVPRFIADIPRDPETGVKFREMEATEDQCSASGVEYATGYTIMRGEDGAITLAAPSAQGETIELTIR